MSEPAPDIRLIAVDLDHTLLDHDLRVPERNRRALAAAAERGATVAIATGRTHESAERFALELGLDAPVISYNGAMIRRPGELEPMRHVPLPADLAAEIVERLVREQIDFIYFHDNVLHAQRFDHWAWEYLERTGDRPVVTGDMRRLAGAEPTKILLMGSPEETLERYELFAREYRGRVYATVSLPQYVELLHPEATKAGALRWLAGHLGVPMKSTMALGDSLNDLEMVQAAGVGVFMAAADEKLRAQADFVPDSAEGGVAEAVERLVLAGARRADGGES